MNKNGTQKQLWALRQIIAKQRAEIEAIQKNPEQAPADYSLGFVNACIFIEHRFSNRKGDPVFYTHRTQVGALPRPMQLEPGAMGLTREEIMGAIGYAYTLPENEKKTMDSVLAKSIVEAIFGPEEPPKPLESSPTPGVETGRFQSQEPNQAQAPQEASPEP